MATVFTQALGGSPDPADTAYQRLLAELQTQPQRQPNMFTPEEIQARIAGNNALTELGVVGQLAGAEDVRGLGGSVFKKALADRQERITNRGVQDPLTGETAIDPEYAREQEQGRRGQVLQQALAYEERRQRARERDQDRQNQHQYRLEEIRARAAQGRATDAELLALKKDLLRSQIGKNESQVELAEGKVQDKKDKAQVAADMASARAADISERIGGILNRTGFFSTGATGALLGRLPGTGAYDLRKDIDTIKANIGFQELQAMRQASPTGGALGQVAVQELNMLQAVLGNLDANQSEEQLRGNLTKVKEHFDNWASLVQNHAASLQDRSPAPAPGGSPPTPRAPGQPAATPAPGVTAPTPARPGVSRYRLDATGKLVPVNAN